MKHILILLTLIIGFQPETASAIILEKCFLDRFRTVIGEPYSHSLIIAAIRSKIAKDPEYVLSNQEKDILDRQLPNVVKSIDNLRKRSKISRRLRVALNANLVLRGHPSSESLNAVIKILRNPKIDLSEKELTELSTYINSQVIRDIAQVNGRSILAFRRIKQAALSIAFALILAGSFQQFFMEELVSREDWEKEQDLEEDEFEIIFYSIHTSIRIGKNEYDYMMSKMRVNALEYYESQSSTRIRFKTSKEKVKALELFLQKEVGGMGLYFFYPGGSTCISHVNRAIEKTTSIVIPAGIDRSPAFTCGYFKLKKLLGDQTVDRIIQIPAEGRDSKEISGINFIDSFIGAFFLIDHIIIAQWDRTSSGFTASDTETLEETQSKLK